jgi:CDP-diacylglycerol--glycerol-3-phosphate 3-phosphatidyltransferase
LSAFRVVCAPVLLALAWTGNAGAFLTLFALGLVSDVLDGALARRLGQESDFGAWLDQWADFALWVSFPIGAWWLWPEIVRREAPYVILAVVCLLLPTVIAYAKYRAIPGYHTWSAKLDSVLMGIGVPLLLIFDLTWPFRLAALFLLVCAVDELAITYLLPQCRHDVPSVFHAARLRQHGVSEHSDPSPAAPRRAARREPASIRIHAETPTDHGRVYAIQTAAFGGPNEAELVDALRASAHPQLSLVAEVESELVGHIFFSPVSIDGPLSAPPCAGLAPVGVLPSHQGRGIGTALIRTGLDRCSDLGWKAVFLVGNPDFYSRFGFALAAPRGLRYESASFDTVFQVLELQRGALRDRRGWVRYHEAFARTV